MTLKLQDKQLNVILSGELSYPHITYCLLSVESITSIEN